MPTGITGPRTVTKEEAVIRLAASIIEGLPDEVRGLEVGPQPHEVCETTLVNGERCLGLNIMFGDRPVMIIIRPQDRQYAPRPHGRRTLAEYRAGVMT